MRKIMLALVLVALALLAPLPSSSQSSDLALEPLKGLVKMGVFVEKMKDDLKTDSGLNEAFILAQVEAQLRAAEIMVVDMNSPEAVGAPYLCVNISSVKGGGNHAVNISVQFKQFLLLRKNNDLRVTATTWERSAIGLFPTAHAKAVKDSVPPIVAAFIQDFLKANPK